ncbi:hypothetical protein [Chondromyces apiculatus]|uniref:Uncharacterized protein n=1 Tax=Chondromyces apiculatus DSM 436 TaxID=1192034 RepID=A0A017T9G4_9BACT|nr:hypothetical protein [Chondromyces apiculatus]EYF05537.1 Hypothetical protein CAP_3085 [Chondromyces apiculatus DSM 436]
MPWLWYVAPIVVIVLYFLTGLPGRHERRRDREVARFRELMRPEEPGEIDGPQPTRQIPAELSRLLEGLGGGPMLSAFELHHKLAYVAIMGPDFHNSSEYQVVLARLDRKAPSFRVSPLALIDGQRVPNTGIKLKKDASFTDSFQIDGTEAKRVSKWLTSRVRDSLRDLPYAWLVVDQTTMALAIHGPVDADRLYALITAADSIFAEHGAEGGPSLFFDDDDDDENGAEGDEEDEATEDEAPRSGGKSSVRTAGRAT